MRVNVKNAVEVGNAFVDVALVGVKNDGVVSVYNEDGAVAEEDAVVVFGLCEIE